MKEAAAVLKGFAALSSATLVGLAGVIAAGKITGWPAAALSLAAMALLTMPADVIAAGTAQFLDPFLGERLPQRWDSAAERYAAAVTLFEMATGRRPVWGDGRSAPILLRDTLPNIDPGLFDDEVRADLTAFFTVALQRDPDDRFHTADEMRSAWRRVFNNPTSTTSLDADPPSAEEIAAALFSVALDTPAVTLPLSGLAKASFARLGINTAEDLATFPAMKMSNTSGIGNKVRQQLRDLGKALRLRFETTEPPSREIGVGGTALLRALVPESADRELARATLGLHESSTGPWPPRSEALTILGLDKEAFTQGRARLRRRWLDLSQLTIVRDRLTALLDDAGGIASGAELAEQVIGQLGYAAPRDQRARASRAIVLAALEADRGLDRPQFTFRMAGRALIVAGHGDDNNEVVDWASRLGAEADELSRQWPLALPAAASNASAVSSRLELYPRGMAPERAVEGARAALLGRGTLAPSTVQARVMGRFSQAADLPSRPKLDELLETVGLIWNPPDPIAHTDGGYRPPTSRARHRNALVDRHAPINWASAFDVVDRELADPERRYAVTGSPYASHDVGRIWDGRTSAIRPEGLRGRPRGPSVSDGQRGTRRPTLPSINVLRRAVVPLL